MKNDRLILIIDNDKNMAALLDRLLKISGYHTLLAYDSEEALKLIHRYHPDLLLLEISMPGMDGYELVKILQNNAITIPFIFLTAKGEEKDRVFGLELGAEDYIVKPFYYKELLVRIARIIQNNDVIHKLKREKQDLFLLSILDDLTGLYTKRYIMGRMEEEILRAERYHSLLTCMMLDIDCFKQINDTYGHLKGDAVLASLAAIIRACTRSVDIAARFGGEEFILLLPQTDESGGYRAAEKLRQTIEQQAFLQNTDSVFITVSVGICSCQPGAEKLSPANLIQRADHALYEAKKSGRNCTRVYKAPRKSLLHED